jgi:hypothetical protein
MEAIVTMQQSRGRGLQYRKDRKDTTQGLLKQSF